VYFLLDPLFWTPRLRQILLARGPSSPPEKLPYGLLVVSPARQSCSFQIRNPKSETRNKPE
jgi:hypothetical protein